MRTSRLAWGTLAALVIAAAYLRRPEPTAAPERTRTPAPAQPTALGPEGEETLTVRVVDLQGQPIEGVRVRVADADTRPEWAEEHVTGTEGHAAFSGRPPFGVRVYETIAHEHAWTEPRGGEVTVTLHGSLCTLRVAARTSDGLPLDDLYVDLARPDVNSEQVHGEGPGVWEVSSGALPCGPATVTVWGVRGRRSAGVAFFDVDLRPDEPTERSVILQAEDVAQVRAVGPDGTPVTGTYVGFKGSFEQLSILDGGPVPVIIRPVLGTLVSIGAPGFEPSTVHLPPGSPDVTVRLEPTGRPGVDLTIGKDGVEVYTAQTNPAAASKLAKGDLVTGIDVAGVPVPGVLMELAPWETTNSALWVSPWIPTTLHVERADHKLDVDL